MNFCNFVYKLRVLMFWISQNGSLLMLQNLVFDTWLIFEVAREVNSWARKETRGLIKEVITDKQVTDDTMLILANAIYFKGTWTQKFNTSSTKERDFHLLNGNKVRVPFMTNYKKQFVHEYDDFKDGLPSLINKGL
ncbi:putative Serpin family protein [Helianthus annuus]|nr:putative Serpin family protein [Helianthus annuus]